MWQNKWKQCYRECSKWPPCAWKHAPSRFRHWSMASSMTLCCSPVHVSTSRCWKMTFLTFPRYSSYSMLVRWANLQPFNVKFFQDSVCQKMIKIGSFLTELFEKVKMWAFLGHSVECKKVETRCASQMGLWAMCNNNNKIMFNKMVDKTQPVYIRWMVYKQSIAAFIQHSNNEFVLSSSTTFWYKCPVMSSLP